MLASDKINLEKITFLVCDDNAQCLDIMAQVVSSFGARTVLRAANAAEARELLQRTVIDFILIDGQMPGESGYELIEWLRRDGGDPNRFAPTIIVTGHTRVSQVARSRDCGANFVVAKPITPRVILERILWVSRDQRMFIESDAYCGPDRRFKREGPPAGEDGRRADDLEGAVSDSAGPNLSQEMIDSMMKPAKVAM